MNLEELISKYLDGEMTGKEDEILRDEMSSDGTARLKFDSAVNLHMAMKEDAESIFPSDELVAQTEDMILMRIFANAPETKRKKAAVWSYAPMLAATIAFFMFVSVFEISDLSQLTVDSQQLTVDSRQFTGEGKREKGEGIKNIEDRRQKTEDRSQKSEVRSKNLTENRERRTENGKPLVENNILAAGNAGNIDEVFGNAPFLALNAPISPVAINLPEVSEEITDNGQPITDNEQPITDNGQPLINNGSPVINSAIISMNDNKAGELHALSGNAENSTKFNATPTVTAIDLQLLNEFTSKSDVRLASFFGTDIARGGIDVNDAVISHFSQSVAYAMNDNDRFGVEVGFTQYSFVDKGTVNVEHKVGGTSGVESYEGGYEFSISYPQDVALQTDKQLLWASAFYENTFFDVNGLSFAGRIGIGGTSDGPLGYGRLFAQYSIFNGFYLTFGAEARMFSAEFSKFIENEEKFKKTASLIYGIQFKF